MHDRLSKLLVQDSGKLNGELGSRVCHGPKSRQVSVEIWHNGFITERSYHSCL